IFKIDSYVQLMKKVLKKVFFEIKEQDMKNRDWAAIRVSRFLFVMFFFSSVFNSCISFRVPEFKDIDDEADVRKVSLNVDFTDKAAYFPDFRLPARLRKELKEENFEKQIRIQLQYLKRRVAETESASPFFPYIYYVNAENHQYSFEYQISAEGCIHTEKQDVHYQFNADEFRIKRPIDIIAVMTSWTLFLPTPNYFVGIGSLAFFFSPVYLNRHQTDLFQYEKELIKELRLGIDRLENKCK
ncbi:MAG TPA: hypothetical protein PKK05_19040, partial [Leptospiraceae bacterium]|nr:hypothetical protein [Leptospiraceae bacterium]